MTKQLDFFSDPPEPREPRSHAQRCKKFGDYEGFVAKFKPKSTTSSEAYACYLLMTRA